MEDHKADDHCMQEFWSKEPEAWEFVNTDQVKASHAMRDLSNFIKSFKDEKKQIVWVARPSAYDWQWIKNYYETFKPENAENIGFSSRCISTLWWSYCKQNKLSDEQEKLVWDELKEGLPHTHNPIDDARSQGTAFINLCKRMDIKL